MMDRIGAQTLKALDIQMQKGGNGSCLVDKKNSDKRVVSSKMI